MSTVEQSPFHDQGERSRVKQAKADAIIEAAAGLFAEQGYSGTTLDGVAARLGITKPTLYYYFANKEEILIACMSSAYESVVEHALVGAKNLSARDQLFTVAGAYLDVMMQDTGRCLVRVSHLDLTPAGRAKMSGLKGKIDAEIQKILASGIRDGTIRDCDVRVTASAIGGVLNAVSFWKSSETNA
ncbi:MAG: TetR/AcrR family transcriptional regulator, partial [Pseudomonadota bacterium]